MTCGLFVWMHWKLCKYSTWKHDAGIDVWTNSKWFATAEFYEKLQRFMDEYYWNLFSVCLHYGLLKIDVWTWCVPSSAGIFFSKLDLAHKWINCCNKSINVGAFTTGIVCIIYLNCFGIYLALLFMFSFQRQCLVISDVDGVWTDWAIWLSAPHQISLQTWSVLKESA